MQFVEKTGSNGRPEYYANQDLWVVYCPPPGQSSGPRKVKFVKAGGFVGTSKALDDICGPYKTQEEAQQAARKDSVASGYPDATVY